MSCQSSFCWSVVHVGGTGAELEGVGDEPAEVGVGVAVVLGRFGGHAGGDRQAGGLGGLGRVLGQVGGDGLVGDVLAG